MREIKFRAWDKKEKMMVNIEVLDIDKGIGWDYYNYYDG